LIAPHFCNSEAATNIAGTLQQLNAVFFNPLEIELIYIYIHTKYKCPSLTIDSLACMPLIQSKHYNTKEWLACQQSWHVAGIFYLLMLNYFSEFL